MMPRKIISSKIGAKIQMTKIKSGAVCAIPIRLVVFSLGSCTPSKRLKISPETICAAYAKKIPTIVQKKTCLAEISSCFFSEKICIGKPNN